MSSGSDPIDILDAHEAERARFARDLHDGPVQVLTNAIFQVEVIERLVAVDPAQSIQELRNLRSALRRELASVRDIIDAQRPSILDELGLDGAIQESADRLSAATGASVSVELAAPSGDLEERTMTAILRIAQEALQNIRKHAAASGVTLMTAVVDDDWTLEITDDGRGFAPGTVATPGHRNLGLQFMRERAALIGARLDVRSQPGDGTVVRLAIPASARAGAKESG